MSKINYRFKIMTNEELQQTIEKLKELQRKADEKLNISENVFYGIEEKPDISIELANAIVKLVAAKYRNCDTWDVNINYRFSKYGIERKIFVRDRIACIDFTESEAILIANSLEL